MAYFIDPDSSIASVLDAILETAGSNFGVGYDGTEQPYDVAEANSDILIQYDMPGGSKMEGHANPSKGGNIGAAIHSLLMLLAPAVNAYALILPILGVIRGIIEVICSLMNPFAVIAAVIRLFVKWIPPFVSLFPPSGGIVLLISTIKAIMALIYYIMTEIIPTIQLMIENIKELIDAFSNKDDIIQIKLDTVEFKLKNLVKTLLQKMGIMGTFKPILELIFLILRLLAGFPCDGEEGDTGILPPRVPGDDSTCCDDFCPEILSVRSKAPEGKGVLFPTVFGDCAPLFVFQLITTNIDVARVAPYQQNLQQQLFCQMDEAIKLAQPAGGTSDRSLLKVTISDVNDGPRKFTVPILDIEGAIIKIGSPVAVVFSGQLVKYKIEIDYDMMVMHNIIGIGCHPDVKLVKDNLSAKFPLTPVFKANPEAESLLDDYSDVFDKLTALVNDAGGVVDGISADTPPFDDRIQDLTDIQDESLDLLNNFLNDLTDIFSSMLARNIDTSKSILEVNRNTVTSDGEDFALITVTPRDITGSNIARSIPTTITVNVEILSSFGTISNKKFDNSTGTVTAELRSDAIGSANVTAKVNNNLITIFNPEATPSETDRVEIVKFVPNAPLPTRRRRSKQSRGRTVSTGNSPEKEPGSK